MAVLCCAFLNCDVCKHRPNKLEYCACIYTGAVALLVGAYIDNIYL